MNKELMLKIADHIEAHPEMYDQAELCGTPCCIAGWAVRLSGLPVPSDGYIAWSSAEALLEIPPRVGNVLFSATPDAHWPEPFAGRWCDYDGGFGEHALAWVAASFLRAIVSGEVTL